MLHKEQARTDTAASTADSIAVGKKVRKRGRPPKSNAALDEYAAAFSGWLLASGARSFNEVASALVAHAARSSWEFKLAQARAAKAARDDARLRASSRLVFAHMVESIDRGSGLIIGTSRAALERFGSESTVKRILRELKKFGYICSFRRFRDGHWDAWVCTSPALLHACENPAGGSEKSGASTLGGSKKSPGGSKMTPYPDSCCCGKGEGPPPAEGEGRGAADAAQWLTTGQVTFISEKFPSKCEQVLSSLSFMVSGAVARGEARDVVHEAIDVALAKVDGKDLSSPASYIVTAATAELDGVKRRRTKAELNGDVDRAEARARAARIEAETLAHAEVQRMRPRLAEEAAKENREAKRARGGTARSTRDDIVTDATGRERFSPNGQQVVGAGVRVPHAGINRVWDDFPEASADDVWHAIVSAGDQLTKVMNESDKDGRRTGRLISSGDALKAIREALWARRRGALFAERGAPERAETAAHSDYLFSISLEKFADWQQRFPKVFAAEKPQAATTKRVNWFVMSLTLRAAKTDAQAYALANWNRYGEGLQEEVEEIFIAALTKREHALAAEAAQRAEEQRVQDEHRAEVERVNVERQARGANLGAQHNAHVHDHLRARQSSFYARVARAHDMAAAAWPSPRASSALDAVVRRGSALR
ncbi:MAG: hypothetical protein NW223_23905 [Hyphomicrobiaceae bacterium]|nr:hypothetical protein [Hyphomicrobiaceae bacterium]